MKLSRVLLCFSVLQAWLHTSTTGIARVGLHVLVLGVSCESILAHRLASDQSPSPFPSSSSMMPSCPSSRKLGMLANATTPSSSSSPLSVVTPPALLLAGLPVFMVGCALVSSTALRTAADIPAAFAPAASALRAAATQRLVMAARRATKSPMS